MNNNNYTLNIITDCSGNNIVVINDIRFHGRQNIDWDEVKEYLKEYIGSCFEILETSERVFISSDFPDEFKGSKDTMKLKGTAAKAKANATLGIPLLIENATNKRWQENLKEKHKIDALNGWYRYTSRFALPVYSVYGELERYNVFRIEMLVRKDLNNKLYLYDMINVKKEAGTPPRP